MNSSALNRSRRQFNKPKKSDSGNNKNKAGSGWKRTFTRDDGTVGDEEELDDKEQCLICANKIMIAAKSSCTHTTCHVCTFRQRALYNKSACLVCRTENEKLIFTEELQKEYSGFRNGDFVKFNEEYGIEFTSHNAHDVTLELLNHRCLSCQELFPNFDKLSEHVRDEHDRFFCTICSTNKKAFPQELKLYTYKQLQNHQIRGDEKGFDGHPSCRFCNKKKFYSEDELLIHMRERHEKCHVCDQLDSSNPQYFKNYSSLEDHFRSDHYICNVQSCLDKKFVVFADELDLQAHMIAEHGGAFGNGFVVGASHNNNNRFHSQLSTFRSSNTNNRSSNRLEPQGEQIDTIETKRMRLEERARHYLNYASTKFKEFQDLNKLYKEGHLSANQIYSSYKSLFKENNEDDVYLLLFELSELLPSRSSQREDLSVLVKKHEQSTKEEHDFPALPGSSSGFGDSWTNSARSSSNNNSKSKKKALEEAFPALPSAHTSSVFTPVSTTIRYKTITKPKPKTQVRVDQTPSTYVPNYLDINRPKSSSSSKQILNDDDNFPSLPTAPASARSILKASSSASLSTKKPASKQTLNEDLFPALPSEPARRVIPRVNPAPKGNGVWDSGSNSSSAANSSINLTGLDEAMPTLGSGSNGGKKNKKKKQILFQMGGH